MLQSTDESKDFFNEMHVARLDIVKEVFELLGYNLGKSKANVKYHNYMDSGFTGGGIGSFGDIPGIPGTGGFSGGNPNDSGLSEGMFKYIYQIEAGIPYGKTLPENLLNGKDLGDANGHKTYGAGLLYHPQGKFMDQIKSRWEQAELDALFVVSVSKNANLVRSWAQKHGIQLNQNQIDAIVSGIYNFGQGFLNKSVCKMILKNPNDPNIHGIWAHMSDKQGQKYPGLIKRRNLEANWYFGRFS